LPRGECLDNSIKGLTHQNIRLLLDVIRVNQESSCCHYVHVVVLSTGVNINGLSIKDILITLNVEFVRSEDFSTLNQDPERVLEKLSIGARRSVELGEELFDGVVLLKHLFNRE
jgi:hypothetical protein